METSRCCGGVDLGQFTAIAVHLGPEQPNPNAAPAPFAAPDTSGVTAALISNCEFPAQVVWGGVRTRDTTIRMRAISARQQLGQLACACQLLAAARGGFLPSAAAIAEISGRMKKASSAG
jgi:hypothetical protein